MLIVYDEYMYIVFYTFISLYKKVNVLYNVRSLFSFPFGELLVVCVYSISLIREMLYTISYMLGQNNYQSCPRVLAGLSARNDTRVDGSAWSWRSCSRVVG